MNQLQTVGVRGNTLARPQMLLPTLSLTESKAGQFVLENVARGTRVTGAGIPWQSGVNGAVPVRCYHSQGAEGWLENGIALTQALDSALAMFAAAALVKALRKLSRAFMLWMAGMDILAQCCMRCKNFSSVWTRALRSKRILVYRADRGAFGAARYAVGAHPERGFAGLALCCC